MPTRVALIRHGAYAQPAGVPSAHLPYPLTAAGEAHAVQAAEHVISFLQSAETPSLAALFCSPLLRAHQTCVLMAKELTRRGHATGAAVEEAALAERSLGAGANLTVEQIETALRDDPRVPNPPPGWKRQPDYRLPWLGAESLRDAGARVAAFVESRLDGANDGLVVCVGHGGSIRHAAVHWGVLDDDGAARRSMHYGGAVLFERRQDRIEQIGGAWKMREQAEA